jgi:hypothetical protein
LQKGGCGLKIQFPKKKHLKLKWLKEKKIAMEKYCEKQNVIYL